MTIVPRVILGLALAAATAGPLAAQDADEGPDDIPEEPAMAEAPDQFRLGISGGPLIWSDGTPTVDGDALFGPGLERHLLDFLSVRLELAGGTSRISGEGGSADVTTYLAEILLGGRLAIPALRRAGVVPFGSAALGTLLHDPADADLGTTSQNAFSWGGGLEVSFGSGFGARGEWRRYRIQLENVLDPTDRSAEIREAHRISAGFFWEF